MNKDVSSSEYSQNWKEIEKGLEAWLEAAKVQEKGVEVMFTVMQDLKRGRLVDLGLVLRLVNDLVTSCKENEDTFVTLARVKDKTNYTYAHPVNVCIYSIATGCRMGYNHNQLARLGLAALLHDVGEIKLPERMLGKSAKYTEAEVITMQKHPGLGYELLKRDPAIPEDVLMGVLQHHERLDGSGYPGGHMGKFIHPMAKIIALAETFDAMTSPRINADGVSPTEALKTIYTLSGKHYDPDVVNALILLVGMYPTGTLVRLSDNHLALVLSKNKNDLTKPQVMVIEDAEGRTITPVVVDLATDTENRRILHAENPLLVGINPDRYIRDVLSNTKSVNK